MLLVGGGANAEISKDFEVFLPFKPLFCQSGPTNPIKVEEQVFLGDLEQATKFKAKILTGKS